MTALAALCGLLPVAALLAWSYSLGTFQGWFLATGVPAIVVLILIGVVSDSYPRLRTAMIVGAVGGLLGTIGYDLFRIPFAAAGFRLFSPIDSYGVLLLDADSSSRWTGFAGWGFHVVNGVGFGIFYGCVGLGRNLWWGVVWAMVLETATIITPFAATYGLKGHPGLIAIAYAAHVAYGVPLGKVVASGKAAASELLDWTTRPLLSMVAIVALALVLWHRPFYVPQQLKVADAVAEGPSALISKGRFIPEWLRMPVAGCATLRNDDARPYSVAEAHPKVVIKPGASQKVCFGEAAVLRLRLDDKPYSGGFIIIDPTMRDHTEHKVGSMRNLETS